MPSFKVVNAAGFGGVYLSFCLKMIEKQPGFGTNLV
jgi:hypothetical protein